MYCTQCIYCVFMVIDIMLINLFNVLWHRAHAIAQRFFSQTNGESQHSVIAIGNCHIDTGELFYAIFFLCRILTSVYYESFKEICVSIQLNLLILIDSLRLSQRGCGPMTRRSVNAREAFRPPFVCWRIIQRRPLLAPRYYRL